MRSLRSSFFFHLCKNLSFSPKVISYLSIWQGFGPTHRQMRQAKTQPVKLYYEKKPADI